MSKLYKDGVGSVVEYSGLSEYFKVLEQPRISGRRDSSDNRGSGWSGSKDFNEAQNLMMGGDERSHDTIMKLKSKTDKYYIQDAKHKIRTFNDVVGYTPNVPNAIMGLPQSMVNAKRDPKKHRVVDIFVNRSRSGGTGTEQIEYEGALILSFLDALERDGYRVNLYIGKVNWFSSKGRVNGHIVPIKKATEPLNIKKTAFYLVHPSYLRRIAFRIDEVEEQIKDVTHDGYGQVTHRETQHKFIHEHINDRFMIIDDGLNLNMDDDTEENIDKLNKLFSKGRE